MPGMRNIVLASKSKRRSDILSLCGIRHQVVAPHAKELFDSSGDIIKLVKENSLLKASGVSGRAGKNSVIIGADTLVKYKNSVLGKPKNEKEGRDLILSFPGTRMHVYTAVTVIDTISSRKATGWERSLINIQRASKEDLMTLFALMYPYDKAGSFSIDGIGSIIFDNISGSYFNILGLPMIKVRELFGELGMNILDYACQ